MYVNSLIERITFLGKKYCLKVSTVFIGGGTPSILPDGLISDIMAALKNSFDMSDCYEITIECNPGTVSEEKLMEYKRSGINRLSFGLQSTDNHELAFIGRIHSYEDFLHSFNLARKCGFTNINVDLMSALPYQTFDSYKDTLLKVIALNPEHISSYSLILEEGTPMYSVDTSLLPDEDTEREMYYLTDALLKENGYNRYEISNYAKPAYECAHNKSYWTRINYLGIGLGSSSLMTLDECYKGTSLPIAVRFSETTDFKDFCSKDYIYSEITALPSYSTLSKAEVMEEFMFLGLRLTDGISKKNFKNTFGYDIDDIYDKVISALIAKNLIEYEGDFLKLTKLGIDVSNSVLAEFLEPEL